MHSSRWRLTKPLSRLVLSTLPILALVATSAALAVAIQPGQLYSGGTRLEVAELGAAFTVPNGWRGTLPAGSEFFLMQPENDPDVYILATGDRATRADLAATMGAPIALGDGLSLHPTEPVGARGEILTGRYDVRGGQVPLVGYGEAVVSSHGVAVAYVLIARAQSLAAHEATLRALTASTDLGAPAAVAPPASAQGSGSGGDRWDTYLKGKYIVRYYTATGYTDETHLWLCSDGTFSRSASAGGFGGGASGAFQGGSSGRWTATGAGADGTLILNYGDGSTARHALRWDYQENKLYVDGKRWLHDKNEYCN